MNFLFRSVLILVMALSLISQAQEKKLELVVLSDDFSTLQWEQWSFSEGDSIIGWDLSSLRFRSAPLSIGIQASFPSKQDEWIVSPVLNFSAATATPLLQFYQEDDFWFQSDGAHEVLYAIGDNPAKEDFNRLAIWDRTNHVINGFTGNPERITLDELSGETAVRIAFRYSTDSLVISDDWYIDDLTITQEVLLDAAVISANIKNYSTLSTTAEKNVNLYVQNRGLDRTKFEVNANISNYQGTIIWSASDSTIILGSFEKDTLLYSLPAVADSGLYQLTFFSDLENDQYRGNDTLSLNVQTFKTIRTSLVEGFNYTENPFSEGTVAIVDSLVKGSINPLVGMQHFYPPDDTLFNTASGELASDLSIARPSYILINRKDRLYEPYTIVQDWPARFNPINTIIGAENALKSPLDITATITPVGTEGTVNINFTVTQTAHMNARNYHLEIWGTAIEQDISWLRMDKVYYRPFARFLSQDFNSGEKDEIIFTGDVDYILSGTGVDSISSDNANFIFVATDNENNLVANAAIFQLSPPVTGIEDEDLTPGEFIITKSYPNPFNPSTTVQFYLPRSGSVEIAIYDVIGRRIFFQRDKLAAGMRTFTWNALKQSSGIYFLRISSAGKSKFHKLLLIK